MSSNTWSEGKLLMLAWYQKICCEGGKGGFEPWDGGGGGGGVQKMGSQVLEPILFVPTLN